MATPLSSLERLIARDPGHRNIGGLVQPGHLEAAARALASAERVAIASGFFIPSANAGETDGPPGAKALGDALAALGIPVDYVTDAANLPLFEAIGAAPLHRYRPGLLEILHPTHLVAVERPGRARDGNYYNMRGEDISAYTEPLDEMFLAAGDRGIATVGIGDGGNEVGMGLVADRVARAVTHGARIACTVPTDQLIVAGVSNWGAYGLAGALSNLRGRDLLPSAEAARDAVLRTVAAGAVDGATRRFGPTVDGQPLEASIAMLSEIRRLVAS